METPEFIKKIDWSELRNQKRLLLETINNDNVSPEHKEALEDIMSLIDAVQDYAVDIAQIVKAVDAYDFELEESREEKQDEEPTEQEITDFKNKWGQTHNEICANLGYSKKGSDDLLMVDYFWLENEKQWYPENNSCYTEREQEIANYLRLNS
jgi:hypothetical protein